MLWRELTAYTRDTRSFIYKKCCSGNLVFAENLLSNLTKKTVVVYVIDDLIAFELNLKSDLVLQTTKY